MTKPVFHKVDGIPQLRIESAEDMLSILKIHESRWMATSAPVELLNTDDEFIRYIDTDENSRIRTDEIETAVTWLFSLLTDYSELTIGCDKISLSEINEKTEEGKNIIGTVRHLCGSSRTECSDSITLEEIRNEKGIYADSLANGDGIIPPPEDDPETAEFINTIITAVGGTADITGKTGIGEPDAARFEQELEQYLSWKEREQALLGPISIGTEAVEIYQRLQGKFDEYFLACGSLNLSEKYRSYWKNRHESGNRGEADPQTSIQDLLRDDLLTAPGPESIFTYTVPLNPYYKPEIYRFYRFVHIPILGEDTILNEENWQKIKRIIGSYAEWIAAKPDTKIENIDGKFIDPSVSRGFIEKCRKLIAEDLRLSKTLDRIDDVEKLILYKKHLYQLCNNFVAMPDLINKNRRCLFESGSLIIDGMQLNLCLRIPDFEKHKAAAQRCGMYLLYIKVLTKNNELVEKVVSPVTAGTGGSLRIGKRGIFYTVNGTVYDAQVVDILENPISLGEAVRKPFTSFGKMIERQVEKISTSNYEQLETKMADSIEGMATPAGAEGAVAEPKQTSGVRNLLLGGSVAVAAIGSSFAFLTSTIAKVKLVHVFGVLAGILAAIFLPTIILGIIRLRKRDISFLLEASGWAINASIRLSPRICSMFTFRPKPTKLQEAFRRKGECRGRWWRILLFVVLFALGCAAGYFLPRFIPRV